MRSIVRPRRARDGPTTGCNNGSPGIDNRKNLTGEGNYVYLEATGKGHFIGVTHSVLQNQNGWFGEGDDMIFIDGDKLPTINGTGTEDYFNGAWDFGLQAFGYQHNGAPYMVDPERIGGKYCLYRWHIESPITFEKSIRVTIEHGHAEPQVGQLLYNGVLVPDRTACAVSRASAGRGADSEGLCRGRRRGGCAGARGVSAAARCG